MGFRETILLRETWKYFLDTVRNKGIMLRYARNTECLYNVISGSNRGSLKSVNFTSYPYKDRSFS